MLLLTAVMVVVCSNPLALLCGEVCCSPYRNKDQTDSRSGIMSLVNASAKSLRSRCG